MSFRFIAIIMILMMTFSSSAQTKYSRKNGKIILYGRDSVTTGYVMNYFAHGNFVTTVPGEIVNGAYSYPVVQIANYKLGFLHGAYISFDKSGDTTAVGNYVHGNKVGEWRTYEFGRRTGVFTYGESGNKVGWQYTYYVSGEVQSKDYYSAQGVHNLAEYGKNGRVYSRGSFTDDTLRQGVWLWYDTARVIQSPSDTFPALASEYRNNLRHGSEKKYVSGVLISETSFESGVKSGIHREYVNEILLLEENFVVGKRDGIRQTFSISGKRISQYNYSNGKLNGLSHEYDSLNGTVSAEYNHELDVLISMKKYSGIIVVAEQILIERDSLLYTYKEFHENGSKKCSGRIIGDRKEGNWEYWHANGKKKLVATFRKGRYTGKVEAWNASGVKTLSTTCTEGKSTKPEEVYSEGGSKLSYGTRAFEKQRAKYVPADLIPYYDDYVNVGQIDIKEYPPRGPWDTYHTSVASSIWHLKSPEFESPGFKGGIDDEVKHFQSAAYPEYERDEHIEGENVVTFTVRDDGTIAACEIARSLSPGLDAEALRLVSSMPNWNPATKFGTPREVRCWLEIRWEIGKLR